MFGYRLIPHPADGPPDPPGLTAEQERALELELLARLLAAGGQATLRVLFRDARPVWAVDACDRLLADGAIELVPDGGGITLTDAGRGAAEKVRFPVPPLQDLKLKTSW